MSAPLILIVDDDEAIREAIASVLADEGYRVACAVDGEDAWRRISGGERPALVLLDRRMPRMAGDELLGALAEAGLTDLRVALLTGDVGDRAAGVVEHLAKPIDLDALLAVVARWAGPPPRPAAQP